MFLLCFSVVAHLTEITLGSICDNSEHFGENQSALELMVSKRWIFLSFFCLKKDEFQDRMGWNCCRRHVKGEEATSNTKIVANMPAPAAAAAATSTFAAIIITANILNQTFTILFSWREPPLLVWQSFSSIMIFDFVLLQLSKSFNFKPGRIHYPA